MVKTYSVSEIAERIGRPGEDMRVVGDRIRNWTREGLLKPIGEKNPGTGRSRQYPETALFEAIVLSAITESIGLQVVKVHTFPDIFEHVRGFLRSQSKSGLLVIGRDSQSDSYVSVQRPETLGKFIANSATVDAHIVINLSQLRDRLRKE